jgi:hypothetical protein
VASSLQEIERPCGELVTARRLIAKLRKAKPQGRVVDKYAGCKHRHTRTLEIEVCEGCGVEVRK